MATTYEYLLRRKADLEVRMLEAQKRAQAPFEGELRAIDLALGAIERAGLSEGKSACKSPGERASFAPARRGRRSRSVADMILMVLERGGAGLNATDIAQQLDRRWSKVVPAAAIVLELQNLEADGAVTRKAGGWARGPEGAPPRDDDDQDDAVQVA